MRLLLVNPRFPESFWSFRLALTRIVPGRRSINPPLGLATLAALCPPHWQVRIVDENVEPVPLDPAADVVGVCGMGVQFPRQRELLAYYRGRGCHVVAGGSYASLCPERFEGLADTTVAGEAEYVWPAFCRDLEAGAAAPLYRETGTVNLADSPTPRFDLLRLARYHSASLQFSRGCPYLCDFCDIIVMFGRRPRTKPLDQVGRELDALRAQGVHRAFFVDDNLIGDRKAARALLRYLAEYQRRHHGWFAFGTEVSLNVAQDAEMLQLLREARFGWVFIGIETPDEASLRLTRKTQNLGTDLLGALRRIYASGIDVLAGFIVGFDTDTLESFERQRRFILDSGIQAAMVGLLTALPHTPLHARLERAGRLIAQAADGDNTRLGTNFVPLNMAYDDMVAAYRQLYRQLLTDHAIATRIRNKLRWMPDPVYAGEYAPGESLRIVCNLVWRGILPGGPSRWVAFLGTLPWRRPRQLPLVVSDWITGLSMRAYAQRKLIGEPTRAMPRLQRRLDALRRAVAMPLAAGSLRLSWRAESLSLGVWLGGHLDGHILARLAPRLERLLRHSGASLQLRIDALDRSELAALQALLARLARHGDRISIVVHETLRGLLAVDSSVFHLVLGTPAEGTAGVPAPG